MITGLGRGDTPPLYHAGSGGGVELFLLDPSTAGNQDSEDEKLELDDLSVLQKELV